MRRKRASRGPLNMDVRCTRIRWLISAVVFLPAILVADVAFSHDEAVEVALWSGPGAESDPRVVNVDGHPCGSIAIVRLSELPAVGSKTLEPEKVLEITPAGDTLRIWSAPVDTYPVAIEGDSLVVRFGRQLYRIGTDRSIERLEVGPATESLGEPALQSCPPLEAFGSSVFVRCATLLDRKTDKSRLIAYQGMCT